jgi:polyhydroxyalkanoate synthesis regulator phasin
MEDTFKKLLYAGVGIASQAAEKFEEKINELVEKGKVSDSEGKKIVEDFLNKTEDRRKDFETKFKEYSEKIGFSKSDEVDQLKKKIEDLEAELAKK